VTEADWLACTDPESLFENFTSLVCSHIAKPNGTDSDALFQSAMRAGLVSTRKRWLFATAFLRRVESLLLYKQSRELVDVVEKAADGLVSPEDRSAAAIAAKAAYDAATKDWETIADVFSPSANDIVAVRDASLALHTVLKNANPDFSFLAAAHYAYSAFANGYGRAASGAANEMAIQASLMRDILGNPFRLAMISPCWLTWNGGTIPKLAEGIYTDRAFDRLPILADALEDAGCDNADILAHCRGPGPHVRGCWVVDLLLGKE
jgi:hypothetical protein